MTVAFVLANSDHGTMIVNRLDYNEGFNGGFYGVGAQIMENGCYDPREVELLKNLLSLRREHYGDDVFAIDCGANIGVHTVEWSRFMRGWGSVLAIEAQERIFYALAGNIVIQNCGNARVLWAAVATTCGSLDIPLPDYESSGSFGSFELRQKLGNENIGQPIDYDNPVSTVRTVSIDSMGLDRVDLIKMDVEGMELEALEGARDTLLRCRPILMIEVIKIDRAELKRFLEGLGYEAFPHGMNVLAVHREDKVLDHLTIEKEAA